MANPKKIEKTEPTIKDKILQLESEIRQIEQEYWKRIGKIEALKEIHAINEEL